MYRSVQAYYCTEWYILQVQLREIFGGEPMAGGRQRQFDEQVALEAATQVFWSNGYSGTSLSDLTDAMGINKPSLYAAFGNKEALFIRALNHYIDKHGGPHLEALRTARGSLRSRLSAYLKSITRMVCDPSLPGGCLVAETTSAAGGDCLPAGVSQAVAKINDRTRRTLIDFFRHEAVAGNLADTCSAEVLADYLLALQYGLAVMARDRATREVLDDVVNFAVARF
jgi:AcrR family transcriptional regulator